MKRFTRGLSQNCICPIAELVSSLITLSNLSLRRIKENGNHQGKSCFASLPHPVCCAYLLHISPTISSPFPKRLSSNYPPRIILFHLTLRPPPVAQEVEKSLLGKPLANSVKRLSDDIKAALSSENLSRL